jgi:hypothetical protein
MNSVRNRAYFFIAPGHHNCVHTGGSSMNNSGENSTQQARREGRKEAHSGKASAGAVEIHESESGKDTHAGHTPGKAEGVETPEAHGNE